jgi:hypothetical protein
VLDFTDDLSLLGVGLLGLVALSMGSLVLTAVRYHISQRVMRTAKTAPSRYREAA